MKLITEAALDDQFNAQMIKVQDAVIKLEKLAEKFDKTTRPVASQISALKAAASDFTKLGTQLEELRNIK